MTRGSPDHWFRIDRINYVDLVDTINLLKQINTISTVSKVMSVDEISKIDLLDVLNTVGTINQVVTIGLLKYPSYADYLRNRFYMMFWAYPDELLVEFQEGKPQKESAEVTTYSTTYVLGIDLSFYSLLFSGAFTIDGTVTFNAYTKLTTTGTISGYYYGQYLVFTLYDYNPSTGASTQIAQATSPEFLTESTVDNIPFICNVNVSNYSFPANHKLRLRIQLYHKSITASNMCFSKIYFNPPAEKTFVTVSVKGG
jgi:hypothetical protein